MQKSRLQLLAEQRRRLKIDNDAPAGSLIPIDHASKVMAEVAATFVTYVEALPRCLAGELAAMDSSAVQKGRLQDEVRGIRTVIVDKLEVMRPDRSGGGDRAAQAVHE